MRVRKRSKPRLQRFCKTGPNGYLVHKETLLWKEAFEPWRKAATFFSITTKLALAMRPMAALGVRGLDWPDTCDSVAEKREMAFGTEDGSLDHVGRFQGLDRPEGTSQGGAGNPSQLPEAP
jgi:hypothetical protein